MEQIDLASSQPNSDESPASSDFAVLTSQIVAAFVTQNKLSTSELPGIIASVHASLSSLGAVPEETAPPALVPLMPVKKTITADYLVSLEDGRHYKSLKRHLTGRGLTPATYRAKWGLAQDYPMVAPNYAKQRSELAKALGLGQQRRKRAPSTGETPASEATDPSATTAEPSEPRRRGRPRKSDVVQG